MWVRAQFAIRGWTPALSRLLASWKLSIVLMVVAALYYGLLAIWSARSAAMMVRRIAEMAPFWTVYALLLANTFWCLWKRLPALRRDLGAKPLALGARPVWEAPTKDLEPAALLRRMGYRVQQRPEGWWGIRQRWAALGTYLFHGAFLLMAVGFLTTLGLREEWTFWVAEGEQFTGAPEQVLSTNGEGPPPVSFEVERIRPEFWRDQLLFTALSADLKMAEGDAAQTRINRPLWLSWGSFLRLSGFGYAPNYEILDGTNQVVESAVVKMNVFPPGMRDHFRSRIFPHRVYTEIYPDLAEEDGRPISRTMNRQNPGVRVSVVRGHLPVGAALLRPGEHLEFEGLRLRVPELFYWGEFTLVKDPGAPLLFCAFLLGMIGLLLKIRGPRAEVVWAPVEGGQGGVLKGFGAAKPPLADAPGLPEKQ